MNQIPEIKKIAFVGDYLPRKCGIATFTKDLRTAVASEYKQVESFVAPVNDVSEGYDYPEEVRFEFSEKDLDSYQRTADYLNFSDADVVSLQHEFGIYGGPAGSFILALLRDLRIPVVTTLHTILENPSPDQHRVLKDLGTLSSRLVVMSQDGKGMLSKIYGIPENKIDLISHGIPDMPFVDSSFFKDQFGVAGKQVLLTFGLLSPNKGIENVIQALPEIVKKFPNLVYIILGATHPNLLREHGEEYRMSLERLASDLRMKKHVSFYNRFVELEELKEFIGAADIYITPYLNPAQTTSGNLAYAFGCGKVIVSTPYSHARELLADGLGALVPFGDSKAIARQVIDLLADEPRRLDIRRRAYMLGREMTWSNTAHRYMRSFELARLSPAHPAVPRLGVRTLAEEHLELPEIRIDHLERMTDSTGIFQHAIYAFPDYSHGYCMDDNARALMLTVLLGELEVEIPNLSRLGGTYAAFLNHGFDLQAGRFRNFMGFDRKWLEKAGSDDSHGRALWALGMSAGRSRDRGLTAWAAQLFERALPKIVETGSPRAWAFALLGIGEYFRRLSGDRAAAQIRDTLVKRLSELFARSQEGDWHWFENTVSYANARIPQALLSAGLGGIRPEPQASVELGLKSLRWLLKIQKSPGGTFRAIGSNGFYTKGGEPAQFDQQPIEAHATVSACLEAFRATNDSFWHEEARIAFEWFLGRNDLGVSLYDAKTGGCCDGLLHDRINQNQGAESTLAYLIALAEMQLLANDIKAFEKPVLRSGRLSGSDS